MSELPYRQTQEVDDPLYGEFAALVDRFDAASGNIIGDVMFANRSPYINDGAKIALACEIAQAKHDLMQAVWDISQYMFATFDRNEAVKCWTELIAAERNQRLKLLAEVAPDADFTPKGIALIQESAWSYGAGFDRARADGGRFNFPPPTKDGWPGVSGDPESRYGTRVLDAYAIELDAHVEHFTRALLR